MMRRFDGHESALIAAIVNDGARVYVHCFSSF
jgi:hypothetical protein